MGVISKVMVAAAASAIMIGGASAADLMVYPVAPEEAAASSWDGAYVGFTGGYYASGYTNFDVALGMNMSVADNFLFGIEVGAGPYFDVGGGGGNGFEGYISARAGMVVADTALIYGVVGFEAYSYGGAGAFAGAGIEFAVMDNTTLRLQGVTYGGDTNISAGLFWGL